MNEAAQDPFIGRTISGKYKIVSLLGEGGMGCVYVGEQMLGTVTRKVAVKTLHKHLSHDPSVKRRFEREVGTVAALSHPNTIQVFDYGETDDGTLYIVMEFISGKPLADVIEQGGAMPVARVEKILTQIVGSLQEAHDHGIVHRDLKPDNIVLCDKGGTKDWVEVLDFGIAKRSNEVDEKEAKLTQQGMVLGTPPYMSPEQFTGQPIDVRSDVYALGVMTYEMLTGVLPFVANTPWEWASQHMTTSPTPFEVQPNVAAIPPQARTAVMRALSKRADERYSSVTEYLEAFKNGAVGEAHVDPSSAPMGRAKTEMATPAMPPMGANAGGMAPMAVNAGAGYGPPPNVGPGPGMGPGSGGGAFIPAAPSHNAQHDRDEGGNKTPLLIAAAAIGLITIVGVVLAIKKPWVSETNAAPIDFGSTSSSSASTTLGPMPTTEPTEAPNTGSSGELIPLDPGSSGATRPPNPGTSSGTVKPPTTPAGNPGGTVTPVPTLTAKPPPPPPPPVVVPTLPTKPTTSRECDAYNVAMRANPRNPRLIPMKIACDKSLNH